MPSIDGYSWKIDPKFTTARITRASSTRDDGEADSEPVYRYVKHDYGFRKMRIDGVTGCQIEQSGAGRWTIYLRRNDDPAAFPGSEFSAIAGFFPSLEAAQRVMERIWAALELDALVIE